MIQIRFWHVDEILGGRMAVKYRCHWLCRAKPNRSTGFVGSAHRKLPSPRPFVPVPEQAVLAIDIIDQARSGTTCASAKDRKPPTAVVRVAPLNSFKKGLRSIEPMSHLLSQNFVSYGAEPVADDSAGASCAFVRAPIGLSVGHEFAAYTIGWI